MKWQFKKEFYGRKEGLDIAHMRQFLELGYYYIPYTLFKGYYKAVCITGDHDGLYSRMDRPFPDAVIAQNPNRKFALHFSGGFDSSLIAKLYDREDVDYIHLIGSESEKARVLAATLKGKLHEIKITAQDFISTADEIIPLLREPYPYNDVVLAYIASRKARELGHNLILTGDGGDVAFGGFNVGPGTAESVDIWKTLEPNKLLDLETLQPLMHAALLDWSKTTLKPEEITQAKPFLRSYLRELGLPEAIVDQKKVPWAGSIGMRNNPDVVKHMNDIVENSSYSWIKKFKFSTPPKIDLLFRQYSLVKWLEKNYKERTEKYELSLWLKEIEKLNRLCSQAIGRHKVGRLAKNLLPPVVLKLLGHKK